MVVLIDWLQMPGETEGRGIALGIVADRPQIRVRFALDSEAAARIRKGLLAGDLVAHEVDEDQIEEISVEWDEDDDEDDEDDEDDDDD